VGQQKASQKGEKACHWIKRKPTQFSGKSKEVGVGREKEERKRKRVRLRKPSTRDVKPEITTKKHVILKGNTPQYKNLAMGKKKKFSGKFTNQGLNVGTTQTEKKG